MIPQTQPVVMNTRPRSTGIKKGMLIVGVFLSIVAGITFAFGIVSVVLPTIYYGYGGNPIWSGVIILIGGILCAVSSKTENRCIVVSGVVMNVISILFAIDQILWMSVAAAREKDYNDYCRTYHYYNVFHQSEQYFPDFTYEETSCDDEIAIDVTLVVLGVIELGLAIAAVSILSTVVCQCSTYQYQQPVQVAMYQTGQPVGFQQGGYMYPSGPAYPPQTHIVTNQGVVQPQQFTHYPVSGQAPANVGQQGQFVMQQQVAQGPVAQGPVAQAQFTAVQPQHGQAIQKV